MVRRIITFGPIHVHPMTGENLGSKYLLTDECRTWEACRKWVFDRFGKKWGFDYPEDWYGVVEYGLTPIEWDEELWLTCERYRQFRKDS